MSSGVARVSERNLWRRCLQVERVRSAALMRKVLTGDRKSSKLRNETDRLRERGERSEERCRRAEGTVRQLEEIRDSLRRQQDATSSRLSAQREVRRDGGGMPEKTPQRTLRGVS